MLHHWKANVNSSRVNQQEVYQSTSIDQQNTTTIMSDPNPNGGDLFDMAKDGTKGNMAPPRKHQSIGTNIINHSP